MRLSCHPFGQTFMPGANLASGSLFRVGRPGWLRAAMAGVLGERCWPLRKGEPSPGGDVGTDTSSIQKFRFAESWAICIPTDSARWSWKWARQGWLSQFADGEADPGRGKWLSLRSAKESGNHEHLKKKNVTAPEWGCRDT